MSRKKVLIVYDDFGSGHRRMANIISQSLNTLGDCDVVVKTDSELMEDDSTAKLIRSYNKWIQNGQMLKTDILINFVGGIFLSPLIEVTSGNRLRQSIDRINPDVIVSTTEGVNHLLGSYAESRGIKFLIFVTTLTPAFSLDADPYAHHLVYFRESRDILLSHNYELAKFKTRFTDSDSYISIIKYLWQTFYQFTIRFRKNKPFKNPYKQHKPINSSKCTIIGPLAEPKHFVVFDSSYSQSQQATRKSLGISTNENVILLSSGSLGGEILMRMTKQIIDHSKRHLTLLVMCGRDHNTFDNLRFLSTPNNIKIIPVGLTNNFQQYLSIADINVCRASAGVFIENLLSKTPIIPFGRTITSDWDVCALVASYGLGRVCSKESDLSDTIDSLLNNLPTYQENIERFLDTYPGDYNSRMQTIVNMIMDS